MVHFDAYQRLSRAIFRVMLSGIFIVAGLTHLLRPEGVAARLERASIGHLATWMAPAQTLVLLAGVALLAGGLALALGLRTRLASALLIAVLLPITLTVQVGGAETLGPLFKNIGLTGGLIFFIAHGADVLSIDAWWARRQQPAGPRGATRRLASNRAWDDARVSR